MIRVELKFPAVVVSAKCLKMDALGDNFHFIKFNLNLVCIMGIVDRLGRPSLYHIQLAHLQTCITFWKFFLDVALRVKCKSDEI